jgi:predicted lipoprotein with Yx(FWY)xxD motif
LQKAKLIAVLPLALTVMLAACGSSSKKSSSVASPAPASGSQGTNGSTAASGQASPAALITTKHDKLGTVLAYGSKRLTVYLFEKDKGTASSCTGACAKVWPPVTGKPQAAGAAKAANLGTVTRSDGTTQVTYKGHPLYLYARDKDDGDTYGEAIKSFGAEWYVLAPSGKKVDVS